MIPSPGAPRGAFGPDEARYVQAGASRSFNGFEAVAQDLKSLT